jgi:hypothetical protein
MNYSRLLTPLRKICALVAATLILPALAYAQQNNNNQGPGQGNVTAAPEANAGWVLVPFFGAVLLFSARQLFRAKAAQK